MSTTADRTRQRDRVFTVIADGTKVVLIADPNGSERIITIRIIMTMMLTKGDRDT